MGWWKRYRTTIVYIVVVSALTVTAAVTARNTYYLRQVVHDQTARDRAGEAVACAQRNEIRQVVSDVVLFAIETERLSADRADVYRRYLGTNLAPESCTP